MFESVVCCMKMRDTMSAPCILITQHNTTRKRTEGRNSNHIEEYRNNELESKTKRKERRLREGEQACRIIGLSVYYVGGKSCVSYG